jgi:hypothetical protein
MLRSADPRVVTPFHVRLMQTVAEAGSLYGLDTLRLEGGTALAAFHLHHRESEDLDFFADSPLDARDWGAFVVQHATRGGIGLRFDAPPNAGMARLVAANPDTPEQEVKIDLAAQSPFRLAPLEETAEGIRIASYRDLCTGKLSAAYGRHLVRDFIDLHTILNPAEDGSTAPESEIAQRFSALLTDLMETEIGTEPIYVGRGLARGQNRAIVSVFPLRLIRRIEEADLQRTLAICITECARETQRAL